MVSVVSAAAVRCWRCADAAVVARLRAAGVLAVLLVAEAREVRAAFAASPRVAAAPADAVREAGVRFDAGLGVSASTASAAEALLRAAVDTFAAAAFAAAFFAAAADFAALVRVDAARAVLAGFGVDDVVSPFDAVVSPFAMLAFAFVVRGFAADDFAAPGFAAPGFAAVGFAAVGFAAGVFAAVDLAAAGVVSAGLAAAGFAALDRSARDFAAAVRGLDAGLPDWPDRDPRWSDTPVPVPSAASSS